MAEKIELFSFKPFVLTDMQLVHVTEFNPHTQKMQSPQTLGYFRQPNRHEYPLDLGKGYENYIHRVDAKNFKSPHAKVLHYLMQQESLQLQQTDFCLSRQTMIRIMELILNQDPKRIAYSKRKKNEFVAVAFKGCIFLHIRSEESSENYQTTPRGTFAFKARQYLFADAPGTIPNTDVPVDENKQLYGIFSAKLGNLRLLYSSEITGVENTEPLGDLNDPKVLKQCRLASVKVFSDPVGRKLNWRTNWRVVNWLLQAYLAGIEQQRVAIFDERGLVNQPIDGDGLSQLNWLNRFNIEQCTQFLHHFLLVIAKTMGHADCPHTIYEFSVEGHSLLFNGSRRETNSSLTEEFIHFASGKAS